MWSEFFLGVAFAAAILYLPGYLFWRSASFSPVMSLCCAPLFGVCAYAALPIAYYELGVPCNPVSILGPALALSVVAYALRRLRSHDDAPQLKPQPQEPVRLGPISIPFDVVALILYVCFAAWVCYVVLVRSLPTPDAFANRYDNQTHLNLTRAFIDSGKWSTLHASQWLASPAHEVPVSGDGSFYPSAWHCVTALICGATGLTVPAGINALLVVVQTLVFPLSEFAFLRALFPRDRRAVLLGAIAASAFSNWPWHIVVMGPLFPNILGLSLLFAALGAVVIFVDEGLVRKMPLSLMALSAVSFLATAIAHPNTVFTAYVFLAFYGATVVDRAVQTSKITRPALRTAVRVGALALYAAAIVSVWYAIYHVPVLSGVVNYGTPEASSPLKAIASILAFRFYFSRTQMGMSIACLCGLAVLMCRPDRWRVLCPALFFALAFVATRSGWGPIKYWTAALWYTDRRRLAVNLTIFAMPIASLGLSYLAGLTREALPTSAKHAKRHVAPAEQPNATRPATVLGCALVACIMVASFCPTFTLPLGDGITIETPLGNAARKVAQRYAATNSRVYGADEMAFVDKVIQTIPKNALVINCPGDGSSWAYGAQGLNTMYRNINEDFSAPESTAVMERLSSYATDKDVQSAVRHTGAQYVLLLDKGVPYEDGYWLSQYTDWRYEMWAGVGSVDDNTPGFEVVLAEGDEMRLYRIADVA